MATGRSKPGPETQPLLLDIRRREIDGGAARGNFEPGIGQRRADAVARFLHRCVRQTDDDNQRVAPAGVDLDLNRKGFDAVERGGADFC